MTTRLLDDMSLEELLLVKDGVKRIHSLIHNSAAREALKYLKFKPEYSNLRWDPSEPAGASGIDIVGRDEQSIKVVGEIKTNMLTGADSHKKTGITDDLSKLASFAEADRYFFVVYKKTEVEFSFTGLRRCFVL